MAPRKKVKNPAAVKATPKTVTEPVVQTEAPKLTVLPGGKSRPSLINIARQAMQLQQKHTVAPDAPNVDGYGKPIEPVKVVVDYRLTLSDGTVLHAEGRHADVIAHYIDECQAICNSNCQAAYNGPPMTVYTKEAWAQHVGDVIFGSK